MADWMIDLYIEWFSTDRFNFTTVLHPNSASPKPRKRRRAMLIIFVMKQCRYTATKTDRFIEQQRRRQ